MFVVACFGMFVSARWYTDMFWQMVVTCLLEHFWQVLSWVAHRTRQDHAKILKKRTPGLLLLKCICWDLFGLFQRTFSTSFDVFLLPVHWLKLDDNPNLTTPTQHVMVGITRSKVIYFYLETFPVVGILSQGWQTIKQDACKVDHTLSLDVASAKSVWGKWGNPKMPKNTRNAFWVKCRRSHWKHSS